MKKLFLIILLILYPVYVSGEIDGIWKSELKGGIAILVLKSPNKCRFSFSVKGMPDGVSSICTYKVNKKLITILLSAGDKIFLKYDEIKQILREKKKSKNYFGFIFKKDTT